MPAVYLDNASTSSPKPASVAPAVGRAVDGLGTPGRGASARAREAAAIVSRLRSRLGAYIGVAETDRIILTAGATEALSGVILSAIDTDAEINRASTTHVVTTTIEHNSVRRPLSEASRRSRVRLTEIEADERAVVSAQAVLDAVTDTTRLVAVTMVSNAVGAIQPIKDIARRLRARSNPPLFLVDACQAVGVLDIPCEEWGIDLLAFSGHKSLLGPAGTGAIYIGPRAYTPGEQAARVKPWIFGGTGYDSESPGMPRDLPGRFEAGTFNMPGFAGLLAALEDPARKHASEALSHERRLCTLIEDRLRRITRLKLYGPSIEHRVGMVTFTLEDWDPQEIAAALEASHGIVVRAGLICAPGVHRALGTLDRGGIVRISPGPATTESEMEACARAIEELATG